MRQLLLNREQQEVVRGRFAGVSGAVELDGKTLTILDSALALDVLRRAVDSVKNTGDTPAARGERWSTIRLYNRIRVLHAIEHDEPRDWAMDWPSDD